MFGEYAQVASYMQPSRNAAHESGGLHNELPAHLNPIFRPPPPWDQGRLKSGLGEDFIMIAEFSELEGPKPLMTIPKDGGANFDQNSFAVRILAVDHHNPTEGFSISEDAQIVVNDSEAGIFAFVHHLVLYDNTARGFVRPYCIAFITAEQRKLMHFYEELSWKFKKVARFLKYGNKMVFVSDLERHLKDLEYTKNVLLNQVCKIRLRSSEGPEDQISDARKNAENELYRGLQTIQQSSLEIREILSVLKPLLPDRRLEARFRILEDRAYQGYSSAGLDKMSLPESGFTEGFSAVDELDFRYGSLTEPRLSPLALFKPREYKPVLVETKKAKRFNAPLRGLHELCSWGAKEGLRKLRYIHKYFKRDMVVLELHKNERRLFRPRGTSIYHGQCITGNFLSGVQMKKNLDATEEAEQNWSMLYSHPWSSSYGSLESEDSFKSVDSFLSGNDHLQASPSSFHTYDSMSANIFQSASASPEKEFSLLMSNEYYPDLNPCQEEENAYSESKVSRDFFQNKKTTASDNTDKILMAANEDFSPRQARAFSWSEESHPEKVQISGVKNSLQFNNEVLTDENDLLLNGDLPDCGNSSPVVSETKVGSNNDNNLMNSDNVLNNEKSTFYSKNKGLNLLMEFPVINNELICKINHLNSESGKNASFDKLDQGEGLSLNDAQGLSKSLQRLSGNNFTADELDVVRNGELSHTGNLKPAASKDSLSLDGDSPHAVVVGGELIVEATNSLDQRRGSLLLTELSNISSEISPQNGPEISPHNGPEISPHNGPEISPHNGPEISPHNGPEISPHNGPEISPQNGPEISPHNGPEISPHNGPEISPHNGPEISPHNGPEISPHNGPEISPQNGSKISPHNGSEILPQNGAEISPQNDLIMSPLIGSKFLFQNDSKRLSQNGSEFTSMNSAEDFQNNAKKQFSSTNISKNISSLSQNKLKTFQNNSEISMKDDETLQNVLEIQQNAADIPQDLVMFLENSSSNGKPESKLPSETIGQLTCHGLKKLAISSKLSHSLVSDPRQFNHHIARMALMRGERFPHLGFSNDDDQTRPRTESDASSAFTEISIQDLYQRTNGAETESKDGTFYEGSEAAVSYKDHDGMPTSPSMALWKPRCGAYTVGDWIGNLSQSRPGFGLSEVLLCYQGLDHVVFSLLSGRPVIVAGPAKMEAEVIKIVNALTVFVPVTRRKCQTVLEWTSRSLKITDLVKLKLIGVCRPERRSLDSFVPGAVKKACTVLDIEKRTLVAPPYQGQFIPTLMSKKNVLRSDVQLLAYVEWWLMGILAKAFIFFHSFCLGQKGSVLYSQSPKDQRDAYRVIVSGVMSKLGVRDCDCDIVENLTEMVKLARMESEFCQGADSGCMVLPLTLKHKTCERFRC